MTDFNREYQKLKRERDRLRAPFVARPEFWDRAVADSRTIGVRRAVIQRSVGDPMDGIVVVSQSLPRVTLDLPAAYRLAEDLAALLDAIAAEQDGTD